VGIAGQHAVIVEKHLAGTPVPVTKLFGPPNVTIMIT